MTESILQGPPDEQLICVTCGFCCDGTLFLHAVLQPGEKGSLPEKIEQNYRNEDGKEFFVQPCLYFSEKCTIYDRKRANVCFSYRCQLLKDFAEAKVTLPEALKIVREAMGMLNILLEEYRFISGNREDLCFMQILIELGKIQKAAGEDGSVSSEFDVLQARCNIFEALLIKHFRSTDDFEKMIMK